MPGSMHIIMVCIFIVSTDGMSITQAAYILSAHFSVCCVSIIPFVWHMLHIFGKCHISTYA